MNDTYLVEQRPKVFGADASEFLAAGGRLTYLSFLAEI